MGRANELYEHLQAGTSLGIVCHDNPDADALASAIGLRYIAADAGLEDVAIIYSGTITHQQIRAFVNLFEVDLHRIEGEDLDRFDLLAFVDHAVPGVGNRVPPDTAVDIVIDHHPASEIDARFVDHREGVGATSSIIAEYLEELAFEVDERLATGLLFAIRSETFDFLRGTTPAEYRAAAFLQPTVDTSLLRELANPPLTSATVDAVGRAIENRRIRSACLVTHTGRTTERDALPQAADYLVKLEGITTVVVAGIVKGTIHLSARSIDPRIHVGALLDEAFGDVGTVGGHSDMAGGRIPLGLFAEWAAKEEGVTDVTARLVARRVFATLHLTDDDELDPRDQRPSPPHSP